ncbi:MAG: hypothetical protein ACTS5I_13060, partial [Rhodanobacter sp.]
GNMFWATRLAGIGLMVCSAASVAYAAFCYRQRLGLPAQRVAVSLPFNGLIFAGYSGGLWLWLCVMALNERAELPDLHPWVLLLLVLALLLGLFEGMAWQALFGSDVHAQHARRQLKRPLRFVAALLTYVVPCMALLICRNGDMGLVAAVLAVPSCLLGRWMEQRWYESVLADEPLP